MGNSDIRRVSNDSVKPDTTPRRILLINTNKANGDIGATARPFETEIAQWIAQGWTRAK